MTGKEQSLDTNQLLGFSGVEGAIDLSTPQLSGRLGAKVGEPPINPPEPEEVEHPE